MALIEPLLKGLTHAVMHIRVIAQRGLWLSSRSGDGSWFTVVDTFGRDLCHWTEITYFVIVWTNCCTVFRKPEKSLWLSRWGNLWTVGSFLCRKRWLERDGGLSRLVGRRNGSFTSDSTGRRLGRLASIMLSWNTTGGLICGRNFR